MATWDFWDIMDLLDDKILDNSAGIFQSSGSGPMGNKPADLPVSWWHLRIAISRSWEPFGATEVFSTVRKVMKRR